MTRDVEHLDILRRAIEHMAVVPKLDDVLRTITEGLIDAGMTSAVVALVMTDQECDYCRVSPPAEPSNAPRLHRHMLSGGAGFQHDPTLHIVPSGSFFSGAAAEQRRPLLIGNVADRLEEKITASGGTGLEAMRHVDALRRAGVQGGLFYPLMVHGTLVGTLTMLAPRQLDEADLRYFDVFALHVASAIRYAQLYREVERLKDRLSNENAYLQGAVEEEGGFTGIVGTSATIRSVLRLVRQVAPSDATVLLTGETGTGKELVARAIHAASARSSHALIKVNCGAISAGLVESELFGHEKGAFTGATQRRLGRFELADHGTLFLDEIGELPQETQVKLLRVLQEREFERVGGERSVRVDVRMVAATHRDLAQDVTAGRFRSDLLYRLNVFPIQVPPLRERREDIAALTAHFVARFAATLRKPLTGVPPEGLERLQTYDWPGNIRELQNVIERACVLATGSSVEIPDLSAARLAVAPGSGAAPDGATLEAVERNHIRRILDEVSWRIEGRQGAAQRLGLSPSTLRSRMQRLGIRRQAS